MYWSQVFCAVSTVWCGFWTLILNITLWLQNKCYMQQLLCGLDHCHSHGVWKWYHSQHWTTICISFIAQASRWFYFVRSSHSRQCRKSTFFMSTLSISFPWRWKMVNCPDSSACNRLPFPNLLRKKKRENCLYHEFVRDPSNVLLRFINKQVSFNDVQWLVLY
jgi:serine/threonine protein kinase